MVFTDRQLMLAGVTLVYYAIFKIIWVPPEKIKRIL